MAVLYRMWMQKQIRIKENKNEIVGKKSCLSKSTTVTQNVIALKKKFFSLHVFLNMRSNVFALGEFYI